MLLLLRDKEGGDAQREKNTSQSIGGEHIVQAFQFSLGHVTNKKKKKKTRHKAATLTARSICHSLVSNLGLQLQLEKDPRILQRPLELSEQYALQI